MNNLLEKKVFNFGAKNAHRCTKKSIVELRRVGVLIEDGNKVKRAKKAGSDIKSIMQKDMAIKKIPKWLFCMRLKLDD